MLVLKGNWLNIDFYPVPNFSYSKFYENLLKNLLGQLDKVVYKKLWCDFHK